jgi:cold shock CspA family protein
MTTTDLVSGRITSFRLEQGFGIITLDDGTQVKFDAGICANMPTPEEGAAVRLRVGPAKWGGGLKALYVEPAEVPSFLGVARPQTLEDQLAAVQREHLVAGLSESIMDELVALRFGGKPETGTILELLDAYYTGDPDRARSDGYLRRGAGLPHEAGDVLGELAAMLPNAKLPRQVRWSARGGAAVPLPESKILRDEAEIETLPYEKADDAAAAEAPGAGGAGSTLSVSDPDGRERSIDVASLDDVIELANAALRRAGDGRRVYKLETSGGWHAYLAIASDRALRLVGTLPFAPAPADVP